MRSVLTTAKRVVTATNGVGDTEEVRHAYTERHVTYVDFTSLQMSVNVKRKRVERYRSAY